MGAGKAIVVGAGPVGCLLATELSRRSYQVHVYERARDLGNMSPCRGRSFNLTLTARGLRWLSPRVQSHLYDAGVRLANRVVHLPDGRLDIQSYGAYAGHHLLSIPRQVLRSVLLEEAMRAGAVFHAGHECVDVCSAGTRVTFEHDGSRVEESADLVAGCDGASSVVRSSLARRAHIAVEEAHTSVGYIELVIPPGMHGEHVLLTPSARRRRAGHEHGFHLWPRGDFFLIAQPNADGSYSANLFAPALAGQGEEVSLDDLRGRYAVKTVFRKHFADLSPHLANAGKTRCPTRPGSLRTVRCQPFHHHRTVLLGDAAHTLLPFYGQGTNCSFEDIGVLMELIDGAPSPAQAVTALPDLLATFAAVRRPAVDVVTELSARHREYLSRDVADPRIRARIAVESELFRRAPAQFAPLYALIAFSTLPYHRALQVYTSRRHKLDALCDAFDAESQREQVIARYLDWASPVPAGLASYQGEEPRP